MMNMNIVSSVLLGIIEIDVYVFISGVLLLLIHS